MKVIYHETFIFFPTRSFLVGILKIIYCLDIANKKLNIKLEIAQKGLVCSCTQQDVLQTFEVFNVIYACADM